LIFKIKTIQYKKGKNMSYSIKQINKQTDSNLLVKLKKAYENQSLLQFEEELNIIMQLFKSQIDVLNQRISKEFSPTEKEKEANYGQRLNKIVLKLQKEGLETQQEEQEIQKFLNHMKEIIEYKFSNKYDVLETTTTFLAQDKIILNSLEQLQEYMLNDNTTFSKIAQDLLIEIVDELNACYLEMATVVKNIEIHTNSDLKVRNGLEKIRKSINKM
jgi:hypothetical protein